MDMDNNFLNSQAVNILIVDDVATNLAILSEIIKKAGYVARPVTSVSQAVKAIEAKLPNLILLDITMPETDGFEYCTMLKKNPVTRDIPIIFISALNSSEDKIKGFKLGAVDFIAKPFESEEVTMRINTHIKIYKMQSEIELYNKKLHKLVNDQIKKINDGHKNIIHALAKLAEARDDVVGNHTSNVGKNARILAMSLQLSPKFENVIGNDFIDEIESAASLHDIGKIRIPDRVLLKPGKLDEEEWAIMKTHADIGACTLEDIYKYNDENAFIRMAIDIARYHHERWDGTGYPSGKRGEEIPLAARITSVVDVYDTLMGQRCYKEFYTVEDSLRIMNEESGKAFDPDIINVFNKVYKQFCY